MSSGHDHASGSRRALRWSLALTVVFGCLQVVAGVVFHSLALLADSVHNISDGLALGLALGAAWLAGLPARGRHTFGWRRAEILAALFNALTLVGVSLWIFYEAYRRISSPPDVIGGGVLGVGLVGIVANGIPVILLMRGADRSNLNVRGAIVHAASDVLGSVGAVAAGLIIALTGWHQADPLVGALVGLIVLLSSWRLLRESVTILLEVAPEGADPTRIGTAMAAVPGVRNVHDLHIWTVTSGLVALAAHVVVAPGADSDAVLHTLADLVARDFGITHTTLQLDRDHAGGLLQIHRVGCPQAAPRSEPVPLMQRDHEHER